MTLSRSQTRVSLSTVCGCNVARLLVSTLSSFPRASTTAQTVLGPARAHRRPRLFTPRLTPETRCHAAASLLAMPRRCALLFRTGLSSSAFASNRPPHPSKRKSDTDVLPRVLVARDMRTCPGHRTGRHAETSRSLPTGSRLPGVTARRPATASFQISSCCRELQREARFCIVLRCPRSRDVARVRIATAVPRVSPLSAA